MIEKNLNKHLLTIGYGIKFQKSYALLDKMEKIIDEILYSTDSYFNPEFFTNTQLNSLQGILHNPETENKLVIDNTNVYLEVNIFDDKNLENYIKKIEKEFTERTKKILSANGVKNIMRIGYIRKYEIEDKNISNKFTQNTIGSQKNLNDLRISFSKRYAISSSIIKKNENDYHNAITNIEKRRDSDSLEFSLDYQRYFDPAIEDLKTISFKDLITEANKYQNEELIKWLNENCC